MWVDRTSIRLINKCALNTSWRNENLQTAEMYQDAAMQWGAWGGWGVGWGRMGYGVGVGRIGGVGRF